MKRNALFILIVALLLTSSGTLFMFFRKPNRTGAPNITDPYHDTLRSIAGDIEKLKNEYPQLEEFSAEKNIDLERLVISYTYHTHRSEQRGGWTSSVPNPDADGVWFYIDMHEPDSQAQIHTQPVMPNRCYREKRVAFLMLEGTETDELTPTIDEIFLKHDVRPCQRQATDRVSSVMD